MNVFQRVEQKYLLTEEEYLTLFQKIQQHLEKDPYFESTICNIYFDTDHHDFIVHSLEKPIYKEKIRLRSYQVPSVEDDVFLEMKGKYNGVVFKRRIKSKLQDFYDYFNTGKLPVQNQIMEEIDYVFKKYDLKPQMFIAYNRLSYFDKADRNFRITFDYNLRSRQEDLHLEYGDAGRLYTKKPYYIMEIKSLSSIPLWFTEILSSLKIYPQSFSKYGSIYKQLKEECYV